MKRLLIILGLLLQTLPALAGDRISELQAEGQKLVGEIQQLQTELQNRQVRVIEIQGALKEITPKPEVKA